MKNLLERKEYLTRLEEGFFSNIKDSIKKFFGGVVGKIGKWFVGVFTKDGQIVQAVSPIATISYVNNVKPAGVNVFSNTQTAKEAQDLGVGSVKTHIDESVFVDKTEIEENWESSVIMKNLHTMINMINESVENEEGDSLNEKLDDLKAAAGGAGVVGVKDVDINEFKDIIYEILEAKEENPNASYKVPLILGAPGIGKTQIIKEIVKIANEGIDDPKDMKSFIHINCATLNPGELFMPSMPKNEQITDYVDAHSSYFDKDMVKYANDPSNKDKASKGNSRFEYAVASWLPVYNTAVDTEAQKLANAVANMGSYEKEDGWSVTTGGGGIIFFDEVLRAKPGAFSELMTFLQDGKFRNWKLGNKWIMVAASNRPCDDVECADAFEQEFGAAKRDRFAAVNYVPDVESWLNWASDHGVNKYIIKYIKTDPEKFYEPSEDRDSSNENFAIGANPRNWVELSKDLNRKLKPNRFKAKDASYTGNKSGAASIKSIPVDTLDQICSKYLGAQLSSKFITWLRSTAEEEISLDEIFADPDKVNVVRDKGTVSNSLLNNVRDQLIERSRKKEITPEEMAHLFKFLTVDLGLDPKTQRNQFMEFVRSIQKGENSDNIEILTSSVGTKPGNFDLYSHKEKDGIHWTAEKCKYREALAYALAFVPIKKKHICYADSVVVKGVEYDVICDDPEFEALLSDIIGKYFMYNVNEETGEMIYYADFSEKD